MSNSAVVKATAKKTASLIFLHGLGDTGHGWVEEIARLKLPYFDIICPHAPIQPVSLNGGFRMNSWFDLFDIGIQAREDVSGINSASANLAKLIDQQISEGIDSRRIIIGGFSQGGSVALLTGLTYKKPLGGVLALSTWLPLHKEILKGDISLGEGSKSPILICHGDADPLVNVSLARMGREVMVDELKLENVDMKTYKGMEHSSCLEEMRDIGDFVRRYVPN